jgi:hypothetical protein
VQASGSTETRQEVVLPAAVLNRNKKKGFLKDMANLQRVRTTFGQNESVIFDPDASVDTSMSAVDMNAADQGDIVDSSSFLGALEDGAFAPNGTSTPNDQIPSRRRQRGGRRSTGGYKGNQVVPPSERDVPSNVFVTSQVFQAPRWDNGKRRGEGQVEGEERAEEAAGMEHIGQADDAFAGTHVAGADARAARSSETVNEYTQRVVPYLGEGLDDGEADGDDASYQPTPKELAWTKIEVAFDALDALTLDTVASCTTGSTLGWKVC